MTFGLPQTHNIQGGFKKQMGDFIEVPPIKRRGHPAVARWEEWRTLPPGGRSALEIDAAVD